jgi:tRNA (cmo5U34)-methyltransferase
MTPLYEKSSIERIRQRFDGEVERFSKLETGQQAAIDSPLMLELVAAAAATHLRPGMALLDIGCGAGNFTLSVLARIHPLECTLVDLSQPMLDKARERVRAVNSGGIDCVQSDMRALGFAEGAFDAILAGAVLHHLRDDVDWRAMFGQLCRWLRPGGLLFVSDFLAFDDAGVQAVMWARYGEYLERLGGGAYREKVFAYVDAEDSPRSLKFQFELLREAGFAEWDVLHRNSVFGAYYARKARSLSA